MDAQDLSPSSEGAANKPALDFHYRGRIYVRPIGRGIVLEDRLGKPHLDDLLEEGEYEAEIRLLRKLK